MKTIEEIRLENLRTLCAGFKSQRKFAAHLGRTPTQVNQWLGKGTPRAVANAQAREIEEKCGKPRGWLDHNHADFPIESDGYTFPMIES